MISFLGYGIIVVMNVLIQGCGVKIGLIIMDGFCDLLEIGWQKCFDLYDLQVDKLDMLVSCDLWLGVVECLCVDGLVEDVLDEDVFCNVV